MEADGEFRKGRTEVRHYKVKVETGAGDLVANKSDVLLAVAVNEFFQIFAGVGDVFPQRRGRDVGILGPAGVEQFVMRFAGHVQIASENQMEAGVAVAIVVQSLQEGEHHGTIRGRVKRGVESPVPLAPGFHVGIILERFLVLLENFFGGLKILFGEIRDRLTKHVAFQHRARFKQLHDFFGGKSGNDGAAIRDDGDQSFGGQMAERFAHGNSADLEFGRDGVLPQLLAFAQFAAEDFVAQAFDNGSGQRLARDGSRFSGSGVLRELAPK